jgi:tRNA threonylcarbamoyl adenosine modification protein (Sua5/YciO/YrdC/YwlC family)
MLRLEIEPHDPPSARLITRAAEELHKGCVAGYPTDSVYALGCVIEAKKAAERIYRAKQMKKTQRLAMLCPDLSTASIYAHFSREAFRLARSILPGPYTLVLPASREVPRLLLDHRRRKVGIRIPAHPVTRALLQELGRPLLTTSAIPVDEEEACSDADELIEAFGKHLDLVIDSGPTNTEPTTVLEFEGDEITVIREGAGPIDEL